MTRLFRSVFNSNTKGFPLPETAKPTLPFFCGLTLHKMNAVVGYHIINPARVQSVSFQLIICNGTEKANISG